MRLKKLVEEHFAAVSIFSLVFFVIIPVALYANLKDRNWDNSEALKTTNKIAVCEVKTNPTYEWERETAHGTTHTTYYGPIATTNNSNNVQPLAYRQTVYPDYYVNGIPVIDNTVTYRNTNYTKPAYSNYYDPNYYPTNYGVTYYPDPRFNNQYYGSPSYSQNVYGGSGHPTVYSGNSYQGNSW